MSQFNIAEAKAQFSGLVQKALMGEEVIIARDNRPLVKLVPLEARLPRSRQPGTARGQIHMAADFDQTPMDFKDFT